MKLFRIVFAVLGLALAVGTGVQASPLLVSDVPGNGLLRVANQTDQSLSEAYIRISTTGRFHLHTEGAAPQDFRGAWNNTGPGIYDLSVNQGFGQWGANGSGRLIVNGQYLQQFELAGVTSGMPFYISFGAGGYACPSPGPDGFSLGLGLGQSYGGGYGPEGYFYPFPLYFNYGHYSDGFHRGRGYQAGGPPPRAYSNYGGRSGRNHAGSGAIGSFNRQGAAGNSPGFNRGAPSGQPRSTMRDFTAGNTPQRSRPAPTFRQSAPARGPAPGGGNGGRGGSPQGGGNRDRH